MTNPQDDISVNVFDPDEQETSEWLEALHSVIESEGRDRAHYLMERLADVARQERRQSSFFQQYRLHKHHSSRSSAGFAGEYGL